MTAIDNRPDRRLKESLSALMDNEANDLEMHRVLDHLQGSESLRKTAFSYQLIGETLRQENNAFARVDISSAVKEALDQEPAADVNAEKRGTRWWSPGRFAVAASVTLAVIFSVQLWNGQQTTGQLDIEAMLEEPAQPAASDADGSLAADYGAVSILAGYGAEQKGLTPSQLSHARNFADNVARERFGAYILQHAEQQLSYTSQGVLPFVRAASFERP